MSLKYAGSIRSALVDGIKTPPPTVEYLVVAGGGGGAGGMGGGAGAGGLLTGQGYSVAAGSTITITVGAGGTGGASLDNGALGSNSVLSLIDSATYTVTNSGTSAYAINSASNPTLTLKRGGVYTFNVSASGHPFWIQTVTGAYSSGNIYNTGVTNNGTQSGTITFVVPSNAPATLYYVCQFHSSMQGTINIVDGSLITAIGGGNGGAAGGGVGGSGGGSGRFAVTRGVLGTSGQGNSGGPHVSDDCTGSGGGGAGGPGLTNKANVYAGHGGAGLVSAITGIAVQYAGGGGGGTRNSLDGTQGAPHDMGLGTAGGGNGAATVLGVNQFAQSALPNTGSGGGGGAYGGSYMTGGNGGSGIVVLRYPSYYASATSTTGSPETFIINGWRVYKFIVSGTITF